jgi:ferrous iron transport protein B
MGNPNVGKSVVFNRLTGANVVSSNYPGTTVELSKGMMDIGDERSEVVDVPGTYTLHPTCKAEEIAVRVLEDGDLVINVVDSTNLERSLNLTLQLIKTGKPLIVVLNLWDETAHTGITIDTEKLAALLGVACIPTCAITGQGIKQVVDAIPHARPSHVTLDDRNPWCTIGDIVDRVQHITPRHHTFLEACADASVKPLTGIPFAATVLLLTFFVVRLIGESLIGYVLEPFFEHAWKPLMLQVSSLLGGDGFIHNFLIGTLIDGDIDFNQSFGVLTTGLFVPLGAVLPYVCAFYLILSLLEDSGYLPRLAVMVDTVMHKIGIHGLAIIPMLLGLGCNVPGALATRTLETRRERFIAATLLSVTVPCMALQAMIVGLVGRHGIKGMGTVFGTLFVVWLLLGLILNKTVRGTSPEIFAEIPPYRVPYASALAKKTWMRIRWFIKEALPFVLLGVAVANILYTLGIIAYLGTVTAPVVSGVLGLPRDAVGALVLGFLRKDIAVGMLAPLGLDLKQLVVASVVLSMYFPCVATFTVLFKELGILDMLKATGIMIGTSLIVGGLLNLVLPAGF